jgi:hypothetical protein
MTPVFGFRDDGLGADRARHDGINRERMLGEHDFIFRLHEGTRQQFEDVVGTVAECDVNGSDAELAGQRLFQRITVAVGITMDIAQGLARRFQRAWTRAEGVFIARELDGDW